MSDNITVHRPIVLFLYGSIGSGKSTTIKSILKYLDINKLSDECPCVFDAIRNVYFPGRYKKYHGVSKTNLGNGTDRLCNGVETKKLRALLVRLCVKNNIVILEGISQINCNSSIIQLAKKTLLTQLEY